MSVNTTLTLIQIIALALPAIGIYMTLAFKIRKSFNEEELPEDLKGTPEGESPYGHSYHAMRASVLALLGGGFFLFTHLLIILPPDITQSWAQGWADKVAGGVFLLGVLHTMAGIGVFGLAVAFQMAALHDDLTIPRSLEIIIKDQLPGFILQLWTSLKSRLPSQLY